MIAPNHHGAGFRFYGHGVLIPVLGFFDGRKASPAMTAGHEGETTVFLGVVRQDVVEVGAIGLHRHGRHVELCPVCMDAGARRTLALDPGVAQTQDAIRADQPLDETQRCRIEYQLFEYCVVPQNESKQLLAIAE